MNKKAHPWPRESALQFPLDFPIKIMGPQTEGFAQAIVAVVQTHAPDFDPITLEQRASREGRYVSFTVTVRATGQAQLDALYQALTAHPLVKFVL